MQNITAKAFRNRYSYPTTGLPGLWAGGLRPLFDPEDGGEGGEGGAGGEGGEGGEGGGFTGHTFADENATFMFPGSKTPISVKDAMAAIGARTQHEAGLKAMGEFAKLIREQNRQPQRQPQKEATPQRRASDKTPDRFGELRTKELASGADIVSALENAENGTIQPILKILKAMAGELKELRSFHHSSRADREEAEFGVNVNAVLDALKLPRVGGKAIDGEDVLREMVRNHFFSYDDKAQESLKGDSARLAKEFGPHFEATRKFFRQLEKAEMEHKRQEIKKPLFARPGAGSTANGKSRKVLSNRDVARMAFHGESQT